MQPIIGITMSIDDYDLVRKGVIYNYIRREYGKRVREAGGQPIFLDPSIDPVIAAHLCDGVVISGGEDIDPGYYGQKHTTSLQLEPRERTSWERRLIDACDNEKIRILGICYGSQLLNIHYGGSLHQDIGSNLHHGTAAAATMMDVEFEQDFLGYQAGDNVSTAHRHHQAVDRIAPGFRVVARTTDGVVEAIAGHGHYGLQWHSESDGTATKIYSSFITKCRLGKNVRRSLTYAPVPQTA